LVFSKLYFSISRLGNFGRHFINCDWWDDWFVSYESI